MFEIVFYVKDEERGGDEGENGTSGIGFELIIEGERKSPGRAIIAIEWIPVGL